MHAHGARSVAGVGACFAQKKIFDVSSDLLGPGKVLFQWSPKGNYLAAAGSRVRMGDKHTL